MVCIAALNSSLLSIVQQSSHVLRLQHLDSLFHQAGSVGVLKLLSALLKSPQRGKFTLPFWIF
jgi:hypothetical protein